MLELVLTRWQALNERERRLITLGTVLIGAAVIYFLFFEPAWQGRERLRTELPQLREQVARVEALSAEATALANVRANARAPAVVRSELQRSLTAAGMADKATVDAGTDVIKVRFDQVTLDGILTWMYGAVRDSKLHVVDVQIDRDATRGFVGATVSLERPGAQG